ncbi:MAG TPA: imidazolonepropionase [Mycobacteriales bacterium]|nr:imidazolonepropionase [Mycobacteriales bacterium]
MSAPPLTEAALIVRSGRVEWTGPDRDLPAGLADGPELDAGGAVVLPGFVDSHTHAVWAGSRRAEFTARLAGQAYDGGGIATTVAATRAATAEELTTAAAARLRAMMRAGTTTVEVKSGYGLTPESECRLLDVAAAAGVRAGVRVTTTYLGAHVVPDDRDRAEYVAEVIHALPAARRHGASWCDVFCDEGAFTVGEARRILEAARAAGLGLRLHAEQLAHTGAARLAAELGCASADHLDHVDEADARALAAAGVVATVVPVVALYTRSAETGQARRLLDAGATLALATDCNPGTAWCESMPLAVSLGCLTMGLSVDEALRAATLGGAAALRRSDVGQLGVGARADLVVLDAAHEADFVGHLGVQRPVRATVVGGIVAGVVAD